MNGTIRQVLEVEVLPEVDVAVCGGGTAGVVAALAAARNGAKVMLIEGRGYLGGMLTGGNAGITMFTKYSGSPEGHAKDLESLKNNPEQLHIVGGIPMEIVKRLIDKKHALNSESTVGSYVFTSSEDFKRELVQMMVEAKVKIRFHSMMVDVIKENNLVKGVVIESKSGRQVIPAKQFIDATGDGDIAVRAGAKYTVGVTKMDYCASQTTIGHCSNAGVMFKVGNVNLATTFRWMGDNPQHFCPQPFANFSYDEALERFERGDMTTFNVKHEINSNLRSFQIYNLPTPGVVTICCPSVDIADGCNTENLSRAEEIMAGMLERWMTWITTVPGFENAFLLQVPEICVRETRHIECDYVLTLKDIYHQKKFADCIGFGAHPIDTRPRPEWLNDPKTAYPPRWFFQIPFSSMSVKGFDNLLVAGRCISATHEAFGCIRPTVQCMIIGEAAGTAATLAVRENVPPRGLSAELLRSQLKKQGVLC